jgi:hypothetical protein
MNNPSKLRSEAVLEFDNKFLPGQDRVPYYVEFGEAKQFLSDQIQKAVEETRKEVRTELLEEIKNFMDGETTSFHDMKVFIYKLLNKKESNSLKEGE